MIFVGLLWRFRRQRKRLTWHTPIFGYRNKIFATLWPKEGRGVVMLTPEQQKVLVELKPTVFTPVPGGWGRRGSTNVNLRAADEMSLTSVLLMAWRNKAPTSNKK